MLNFYLPVGPQPFPVGASVWSFTRPWWGIGTVIPSDALHGWRFRIRWADGSTTTAQTDALSLRPAMNPTTYRIKTADGTISENRYIGCDPLDAVCAWCQDTGSLRGLINAYADKAAVDLDAERMLVADRAAPRASARQPWPEAGAIRTIVAEWWHNMPTETRPVVVPA